MEQQPPRESIYQRILREARERREAGQQHLQHQIERIETRIRTHGHEDKTRSQE